MNTTSRRRLLATLSACGVVTLAGESGGDTVAATATGRADDSVFTEFVETDGTDLVVGDSPWYFVGGNHPQLRKKTQSEMSAWFSQWSSQVPELNALRATAFGSGTTDASMPLQPNPGEHSEDALERLDRLVSLCGTYGVRLVLPLTNNWSWQGGMPQYVDWADEASSHDDFYTDDQVREWFKNHISTVLNRQNTVTGVKYKNDPTIAMWELANEPRARWYNRPDMIEWIGDIASHIKSIDPNHLVSTGMGGGAVIEVPEHYREANKKDAIDVYSIHVWTDPRHQDAGADGGNRMIRNHTETAHNQLGMPIYSGEFGWPVDRTDGTGDTQEVLDRNDTFGEWFDTLDRHGTNGGLVWDLRFDQEYSSVSEWNYYAVFPRDRDTRSVVRDAALVFADKSGDSLSRLEPVSGDRPPKDHDRDGLYEDLNGTGESSMLDVQLLFDSLETTAVQNNAAAFDFSNTGGEVTVLDVQALFNRVE